MPDSPIFAAERQAEIERQIADLLNEAPEFMSVQTISSTRAVGDAIQEVLSLRFPEILGDDCDEYSGQFARRAMADLAFTDSAGNYHRVDVKTHRNDTTFNMPNLTSVKRLADFYEDDTNYFVILLVAYDIEQTRIRVTDTHFVPIEWLSWDCLTVGALGWGQLQIANSRNVLVESDSSRAQWMTKFCDVMLEFYEKEIGKIGGRTEFFSQARERWSLRIVP